MCRICRSLVIAATIALAMPLAALGQNADVENRPVTIWSDGTRLAGNLFMPKQRTEGEKLPGIVLCHGWGGVKQHLNGTYAPHFASAGYAVLTFDYRGWGESDSRLVIEGEMPEPDENGIVTVKARAIRELVDPFDQLVDIRNAINYLEGEPGVDADRIGIWGTSFGGGLVLMTAVTDPRVKCVVSQVGAMDARPSAAEAYGSVAEAHEKEIARSRGDAPAVPQGEDTVEGLRGTPHMVRFARYAPVEHASKLSVPILLIDAENEELFNRMDHSAKVYEIVKDKVPATYHVEPGIQHYGIYSARYQQGAKLALDWFDEHLK